MRYTPGVRFSEIASLATGPGAASNPAQALDPHHPVVAATSRLFERYLSRNPAPTTDYDPDWPSPCEQGRWFDAGNDQTPEPRIRWQPVPRWEEAGSGWPQDFDGLENALETTVHPDFKALFSHWSATLELTGPRGHVSLLQVWNRADVERYIENLIGHVLIQRRARAPLTLFFACTEPDSELILSLENKTGAVVLEEPGREPVETLSGGLAEFLDQLEPAATLTL